MLRVWFFFFFIFLSVLTTNAFIFFPIIIYHKLVLVPHANPFTVIQLFFGFFFSFTVILNRLSVYLRSNNTIITQLKGMHVELPFNSMEIV